MSSESTSVSTTELPDLTVARHDDGLVVVTLDLDERRNMMSEQMTASWVTTMEQLRGDRSVRCVVVTGAGSAFSSGGNTSWIVEDQEAGVHGLRDRMLAFYRDWLTVRELEVPTIAAINGHAIGAGMCLALACDVRYAARGAKLAVPFVRLGMHPGMAATWLLPEVAGMGVARDLLLTGRTIDADEAFGMGIVSRVSDRDGFLDEVLEVGHQVAATAPLASRWTKVALAGGGHATFDAAVQWEAMAQPVTLTTADLIEGMAAAKERRSPTFRGR